MQRDSNKNPDLWGLSPYLLRPLFWLGLVLICLLAWLPVENPSLTESYADKVNHVACFLVLLPLLRLAYGYSLSKTTLLLFGYGLVIEAVQFWLPWRKFSLLDLAADGVGLLAGILLVWVVGAVYREYVRSSNFEV